MSKKVIKSSNKNEKYNLKSVLDTDNIMSGVSLKAVTAIGCASVIASCGNDKPKDDGKKDENKLKWEDFKDYQAKFKNGKEDFEKFVSECKKQGISEDKIKEMIENLEEPEVQNVLDGKIKKENGEIKIDGKVINKGKPTSETNDTFSNFDNLSEKQKETLTTYGITDQNTLNEFLNIKDNEGFKNKKISELFNEKDIKDETLKTKLEAYKNSKQQPTPQVSEEKVKKLKELMQHNDDNYTIYNFYDNNIKTAEIDKIYESIKDKTLTEEDKDVSKNNSSAKKLKDIIEDKNNIKSVQLAIFKKIVEKLSKDKKYFEFSLDNKKPFKIDIKFTFKDEKGANKTETEPKTYKSEDINIQEQLDIENHKIYTDSSSLKEIEKSSIDEAFNLANAKDKDGKEITNGAGETKDLNAYLVVLKNNFDNLKELNISNDAIKTKIYGQLLKNIQAKLTDFVDKKLKQTDKVFNIDDSAIVAAMKSTGICKDDNAVIDEDSMKKNPIDNKFFLSAIIGTGGFMNSDYKTMITAMFKHFHDKYDNDNVGDFKKKIDELKSTDFTDNDADTKLKINNGKSTYFEKKTAPAPSGWDKFKNVINQINAIGEVSMDDNPDTNKLNNDSKTIADATKIDHINKAFKAIHEVRTALDSVKTDDTDKIREESPLYIFLEKIVGKKGDNDEIKYENYGVYNAAAGTPMPVTPLTTTVNHVTGGLLPLPIMTKEFKTLDMAKILKNDCTGEFQASIRKYVNLCLPDNIKMTITKAKGAGTDDYQIIKVDTKNYNNASKVEAQNWGCTSLGKIDDDATSFVEQLLQAQSTIGADQNKFLDYIRAMKVVEKIEYTAIDFASAKAIYVGNSTPANKALLGGTADRLNPHAALLTNESDFKQILPFLGKIELVIDILVAKHANNNTADAAGTPNNFAKSDSAAGINLNAGPKIIPYNINRNRVYKNKNTALNDIKGTPIDNKDYSYGILVDVGV